MIIMDNNSKKNGDDWPHDKMILLWIGKYETHLAYVRNVLI